jgi:hypothetical protein
VPGKQVKAGDDGVDLSVGNVLATAVSRDVIPDVVEIGARLR